MTGVDWRKMREAAVENEGRRARTGSFPEREPFGVVNGDPDVLVVTSGGRTIPAHSSVLASASPVLEGIVLGEVAQVRGRGRGRGKKVVYIPGVSADAVAAFIECIYYSRFLEDKEIEKFGVHVLVLSHAMQVPWLKRATALGLAATLYEENVVDLLQLARQCDAPRLYIKCMKLLHLRFKVIEKTEGWKFLQENDPFLELEVLEFLQEAEKREKRRRRNKRQQKVYMELSEAMECICHIFTEGCTYLGPRGEPEACAHLGPCRLGPTCEGVQQLIRHFAMAHRKKDHNPANGCGRCASVWQLLRLHSAVCDQQNDSCRVPLCRQFKERKGTGFGEEDERWKLLARKVVSAKAMSKLSKRKREEEFH